MPSKTAEEPKQTLPAGHPQAGYVSPDLSFQDATGTLPDEEQNFHDERDDAQAEEAEKVAAAEDAAAKELAAEQQKDAPEATTTKKTETSPGSKSS